MRKWYYIFILGAFFACKQQADTEENSDSKDDAFTVEALPKSASPNAQATAILSDWKEYNDFTRAYNIIRQAQNIEELKLTVDDIIEKQNVLAASTYPEKFNKAQIKSRQIVLKTYILKLKGDLEYGLNFNESLKEMGSAYNTYINKFNILVKQTLDTNLIRDEYKNPKLPPSL